MQSPPPPNSGFWQRAVIACINPIEGKYYKTIQLHKQPLKIDAYVFSVTKSLHNELIIRKYGYVVEINNKVLSITKALCDQVITDSLFRVIGKEYKRYPEEIVRGFDISEDGDTRCCYELVTPYILETLFHFKSQMDILFSVLSKKDTTPTKIDITNYIFDIRLNTKGDIKTYLKSLITIWYQLAMLVRPEFPVSRSITLSDIKKRIRLKKVTGIDSETKILFYYLIYCMKLVDSVVNIF